MNTNDPPIDEPVTSARPRIEATHLRVVDEQEEHARRVALFRELAARTEPTAAPLPPLNDLAIVRGTWFEDLLWTRTKAEKGAEPLYKPSSNASNAISILVNDPRWADVLAYDEFAEAIMIRRMPPWHPTDRRGATIGEWTDEDTTRTESWFQRAYGVRLGEQKILGAVAVAARTRCVHPVREYLRALEWDGIKRIDRWAVTLLGAPDTTYTRAVGRMWLISAVARVMRPGCKVDTMIILEGKTGIKKSTALRALAGDQWFTEIAGMIDPKETPQLMRRKWIIELSELAALRRTREQETIKGFLSRQEDNYRPPYGKRARDFPRQSVFAGTTNEERYLRDPTGARRFWPIECGTIHRRGIEIERDMLWAEALIEYEKGARWFFSDSDDELIKSAVAEQDKRYEEDSWLEPVREFCESRRNLGVTTEEILVCCLSIEMGRWTHTETMRLGAVLRRIGWVPTGRERPRRYKPGPQS